MQPPSSPNATPPPPDPPLSANPSLPESSSPTPTPTPALATSHKKPTTPPPSTPSTLPPTTNHPPPTTPPSSPPSSTPLHPIQDVLSEHSISRYQAAASQIGIDLQSNNAHSIMRTADPRADFLTDLSSFLQQNAIELKLRKIGGAELDIYGLYRAVIERGGLQAVMISRAFKMVAKTLNLPKSCTSAAFILRLEYERLLYAYEQKHVWNRDFTNIAPLYPVDKSRRPAHIPAKPTMLPTNSLPAHAHHAHVYGAVHPLQKPPLRPRRQAALAATTAVAAAVSDDPYAYPVFPKRSRLTGLDQAALTPQDEAIVDDEIMNHHVPHAVYVPGQPGEKERVVSALWSPMHDDVGWALGTLNALSFESRNTFHAHEFPGILDALHEVLNRHLEDVLRKRSFGLAAGVEFSDPNAPANVQLSAVDIRAMGYDATGPGIGILRSDFHDDELRNSSLQQYPNLFNLADPIAVDREQCAVVAVNILRNMSFHDRNAILVASAPQILSISAIMIQTLEVRANIRDGLIDMWINVSSFVNASMGSPGRTVLATCIKLLDPFQEGSDVSRFTNSTEVLARLAACPERNEAAIVSMFPALLPRIVDMLGGRNKKYVSAGLAALCNFSAFDWPARDAIARVPRALERLVGMLGDPEFAPRSALTLMNLAESPNNRSVMISHETELAEFAMTPSPAADMVASVLFELSDD